MIFSIRNTPVWLKCFSIVPSMTRPPERQRTTLASNSIQSPGGLTHQPFTVPTQNAQTALRTNDGTGKLKTSPGNFLPYNELGLPNFRFRGPDFFLAGDERANENIGLTSLHTLFVREHNRLAEQIAGRDDSLSGEEIYQMARKIVGAQIQAIAYNEFLPVLLGPNALPPYSHYNDSTPSGVANAFSSAAYRVGHTLLSPKIRLVDAQGNETEAIPLRDAFFQPKKVVNQGIEPILQRLYGSHPHQRVDVFIIDDVRNFLFVDTEPTGTHGLRGFDLATLNIHRGRDHGLPSYNDMREALGLERKEKFFRNNLKIRRSAKKA